MTAPYPEHPQLTGSLAPIRMQCDIDDVIVRGDRLRVVYRSAENRGDPVFLDAGNVADGPVACAELPHRVPFGFHGNWNCNG